MNRGWCKTKRSAGEAHLKTEKGEYKKKMAGCRKEENERVPEALRYATCSRSGAGQTEMPLLRSSGFFPFHRLVVTALSEIFY